MRGILTALLCLAVLFTFGFSDTIVKDAQGQQIVGVHVAVPVVGPVVDVGIGRPVYYYRPRPIYRAPALRPMVQPVLVPGQVTVYPRLYRTPLRNALFGRYRTVWQPTAVEVSAPVPPQLE